MPVSIKILIFDLLFRIFIQIFTAKDLNGNLIFSEIIHPALNIYNLSDRHFFFGIANNSF